MNGQTRRRVLGGIGTVALGTSLAGCTGDGGGGGGENVVEMTDDLTFDPAEMTVAVGETVTWENGGSVTHSVTAYGDGIPDGAPYFASGGAESEEAARQAYPDSGAIAGGESYEHQFDTAGTYEYFCIPHESSGMTGSVVVEEA